MITWKYHHFIHFLFLQQPRVDKQDEIHTHLSFQAHIYPFVMFSLIKLMFSPSFVTCDQALRHYIVCRTKYIATVL